MSEQKQTSNISSNENEEMTASKALDVLVQCAYAGQSRGAWRMEEVPIILKAINFFTQQQKRKE